MISALCSRRDESAADAHRQVLHRIRTHDWLGAELACRSLNTRFPTFAAGWLAASHIAVASGALAKALEHIDRALSIEAANPRFLLHRAHCLLAQGERRAALDAADAAERSAPADPMLLDSVGTLRSHGNDQRGALAAYDRAVAIAPKSPAFRYNRASVRRYLGDLEGAEADYDEVVALKPLDYEAYINRSELRVQTASHNHVGQLEGLLKQNIADWRGYVQIQYALAKEYEDLGDYDKSYEHLRSGAARRRQHMQYDVATDVATVDWIINAFPEVPSEHPRRESEPGPIFIVGLPRSGTTLVERILGSHSSVSSAGELKCFALAIVDAVRRQSRSARMQRRERVAASASLDFEALGEDYLRRARATTGLDGRFTDKMPLNYLYCGLICRALPRARIVHLTRSPMAAGYAMYKTLFKDGYPFSYDLEEIGHYYVAYRRLMNHWRATLPNLIHDLSYEDLVSDQVGQTRKLLEFCALEWEDACVAFHQNPDATTSASASQVRRPIYSSSVSQWRNYEQQLAPLYDVINAAGFGE